MTDILLLKSGCNILQIAIDTLDIPDLPERSAEGYATIKVVLKDFV